MVATSMFLFLALNYRFWILTEAVMALKLDNQLIKKIKKKQKYNELLFKITQYGLRNRIPPGHLISEAKELGREIDIPETELQNIEFSI
jgi:hypothetical protein